MDLDYEELGLKVGFEIHQELDTHKLFCECPSKLRDEEPEIVIERELRPTESELGKVDRAALAEAKKSKKFRYEIHPNSTCLVEIDEEPPHSINQEATDIALEASLLLNADPVDEAHVMRKTVIDGSNTTGFQRTVLLATNGEIKIDDCKIGLATLCLEEDAARKMKEGEDYVQFRLDRLGIPLLEIATDPDFNDPKTPAKAAEKIGKILRATGKVKRGIGTIRQDVNVSIREGARQEIKGVQELSLIDTVIEREVQRQVKLLEIMEELKNKSVPKPEKKIHNVTKIFSDTDSRVLKSSISKGNGVFAVKLEGFDGLLGKELIPDHRFGTELSQYAQTFGKVNGIFHTDELPSYGISEEEVKKLKNFLDSSDEDAVVIVADTKNRAKKGLEAVIDRARMAFDGIPEETRRAKEDGNTEYMRPLPGSERMYVETDVPPVEISEERISKIQKGLPEKPGEKKERYIEKLDLSKELAKQLSISEKSEFFERIIEEFNIEPTVVASTLVQSLNELEGEGFEADRISKNDLQDLFKLIEKDVISKDVILEVLKEVCEGSSVEEAVESLGLEKMETDEVEKVVEEVVGEKEDLIHEKEQKAANALMGVVMGRLGGKAEGEEVHRLLREKINNILN